MVCGTNMMKTVLLEMFMMDSPLCDTVTRDVILDYTLWYARGDMNDIKV